MQPQATGASNPAYFANLTAQINGIQGTGACAAIQQIVNDAMASIQAEATAIKAKIAALSPLTTAPTDLGSVITWIKHVQAPLAKALQDATNQLNALLASVAALVTAITNAASRLVGCSISVPTIT